MVETDATAPTGRTSYAVCAGVKRPSAEEARVVRQAIADWPVGSDVRRRVKRILNISDCRVGVDDGVLLAEAPGDGQVLVIDVDGEGDDWVSIPWG